MLQNITLLNSVQNNAGLTLGVAQGSEHRADLRVETSTRGSIGKRPCEFARPRDAAGCADATGPTGANGVTTLCATALDTDPVLPADANTASGDPSGSPAADSPRVSYQPARQMSKPASMRPAGLRTGAMPRIALPAAVWAALVLSRV